MEHIGRRTQDGKPALHPEREGGAHRTPHSHPAGPLAAVLGERAPAKILIEASTESEWVARCLEQLGHQVVVADPNFAAMYATRSCRVKTDPRDARTLAEACRLGAYE
jgi:transposase